MSGRAPLRLVSSQPRRNTAEDHWLVLELKQFLRQHPSLTMQQAAAAFARHIDEQASLRFMAFSTALVMACFVRKAMRAQTADEFLRLAFGLARDVKLPR
jgi:hypothetical protein